jgi:hypothetical protein
VSEDRDQESEGNRSQFAELVCEGLGYCCPYAFLRVNRKTQEISDRLGMAKRTIRLWKAKYDDKELECSKKSNCLLAAIRQAGK